LSEAK